MTSLPHPCPSASICGYASGSRPPFRVPRSRRLAGDSGFSASRPGFNGWNLRFSPREARFHAWNSRLRPGNVGCGSWNPGLDARSSCPPPPRDFPPPSSAPANPVSTARSSRLSVEHGRSGVPPLVPRSAFCIPRSPRPSAICDQLLAIDRLPPRVSSLRTPHSAVCSASGCWLSTMGYGFSAFRTPRSAFRGPRDSAPPPPAD